METLSLISDGAKILFGPQTMMLMIFGLAIGIFAGALPGFTSTNACAVMLPFTLGMTTEGAVVFIASVYCGAMYGDAVPGILFKTPGSPGAAATILDGHPMALQGKADEALGISVGSSVVGGMIAGTIVLLIIRPMAVLALRFGPGEMFLVAILGISVISSVATRNMLKGLVSGLFGLLVAAMPADPIIGRARLDFGMIELYDTIPFIPVLIGLFAIPTLIELVQRERIAEVDEEARLEVGSYRRLLSGVLMALRRPIAIIRSALIGCFVGSIPGTGASIATFVSYGQAQAWSKDYATFGEGNPDGVIASEAANNAVTGGSMVPALALGIPGSGTTAILLAVMVLHGLRPGPHVVREDPGMVYALLVSLVVAPLFMGIIAIFFNRYASKITVIRTVYLVPFLIAICLVGGYAIRLFVFDFYMVMLFGILGMLMNRTGFPVIPFVLGIILGPIAEGNVVRALMISRGEYYIFYDSPIALILIGVIVAVLFGPLILRWQRERKEKKEVS